MISNRLPRLLLCLICLPLSLSAAVTGETLYQENCAICHGADGTGGVGVPLAMPAFLRQSSDRYLKRTIREGRPGRVMPAFTGLGDENIERIVDYIRGWNRDILPPSWDTTPVQGDAKAGARLFRQHCQVCHGEQGQGGKGTGIMFSRKKDLPIMAPAIGNPGFLHAASDQMIRNIIKEGRPGTPMQPADKLGLNEQDLDHLVSYIRSLEKPSPFKNIHSDEPAVLRYESAYSFDETIENVKRAAIGMNFRLIRDQPLDEGMVAHGEETKRQMIVYFCNFEFLYQALALDPRVGLFLPCRVTVVEQQGKVSVMSINPKRLSLLFNNNELDHACDEMHRLYTSILEEATL